VGSGAGHRSAPAGRQRTPGPHAGTLVPSRGETSQAVAAVAEMPGHWWGWATHAIPGVPARSTRKGEREQEGHRRVAGPEISQIPAPGILAGPGPAVGIDRMPGSEQIAHFEMEMRAGRVSGAAAERDQLTAGHALPGINKELVVVEVGGAVVRVVDDHAPATAVAPLAVDDGALIGRQHRGVVRYGEIRTTMAIVRIAPGAVEPDHGPVVLPVRIVVVRPGRDPWVRIGKRQRQVARRQHRLG